MKLYQASQSTRSSDVDLSRALASASDAHLGSFRVLRQSTPDTFSQRNNALWANVGVSVAQLRKACLIPEGGSVCVESKQDFRHINLLTGGVLVDYDVWVYQNSKCTIKKGPLGTDFQVKRFIADASSYQGYVDDEYVNTQIRSAVPEAYDCTTQANFHQLDSSFDTFENVQRACSGFYTNCQIAAATYATNTDSVLTKDYLLADIHGRFAYYMNDTLRLRATDTITGAPGIKNFWNPSFEGDVDTLCWVVKDANQSITTDFDGEFEATYVLAPLHGDPIHVLNEDCVLDPFANSGVSVMSERRFSQLIDNFIAERQLESTASPSTSNPEVSPTSMPAPTSTIADETSTSIPSPEEMLSSKYPASSEPIEVGETTVYDPLLGVHTTASYRESVKDMLSQHAPTQSTLWTSPINTFLPEVYPILANPVALVASSSSVAMGVTAGLIGGVSLGIVAGISAVALGTAYLFHRYRIAEKVYDLRQSEKANATYEMSTHT